MEQPVWQHHTQQFLEQPVWLHHTQQVSPVRRTTSQSARDTSPETRTRLAVVSPGHTGRSAPAQKPPSEPTADRVWRRDRPSRPSLPAEHLGRRPVGKDRLLYNAGEEQRARRGCEYTDPEADSALTATRSGQAERASKTGAPRVDQLRGGTADAFASAAAEARQARLRRETLDAEPAIHPGNTKPSPAELVRIRLTPTRLRPCHRGSASETWHEWRPRLREKRGTPRDGGRPTPQTELP